MTEEAKKRMESVSKYYVGHVRDLYEQAYEQGMQDPDANAEKISKLELESKVLKEAFVYSDRPFRKLLLKNADLFECFDKDIYESEMKDEFGASDVTGARIFEFRFLKENSLKLQEENKKLRKVVLEADEIMKRNSMFPLDIATWRAHIKAPSSGGE